MIILPEENEKITVTKRVFFTIPGQKRQDMSVEYHYLSKDEFKATLDEIKQSGEDDDGDFDLLNEAIVGIEGIRDSEGNEVAYTGDVLKKILNILPAGRALINMFFEIHSDIGRKEAKAKN